MKAKLSLKFFRRWAVGGSGASPCVGNEVDEWISECASRNMGPPIQTPCPTCGNENTNSDQKTRLSRVGMVVASRVSRLLSEQG